jgi:hypothetical protein
MPDFFDPNQTAPVFTFRDAFASQGPQDTQGSPAEWWKAIPQSPSSSVAAALPNALPGIAAYQASTNPEVANQGDQGPQAPQGSQAQAAPLYYPQQQQPQSRGLFPQVSPQQVQDFVQRLAQATQGPQGLPSSKGLSNLPYQGGWVNPTDRPHPQEVGMLPNWHRQEEEPSVQPIRVPENPHVASWRRAQALIRKA